jgi:hypothetical protein
MQVEMSKEEMKQILRRHPGSQAEVALELGVCRQSVYTYFNLVTGKGSERIGAGVRRKVAELLAIERLKAEHRSKQIA